MEWIYTPNNNTERNDPAAFRAIKRKCNKSETSSYGEQSFYVFLTFVFKELAAYGKINARIRKIFGWMEQQHPLYRRGNKAAI